MAGNWVIESIGLFAGFCTTAGWVPQLLHVWRLKSARDISLAMSLVMTFGVALWLIYGLAIRSVPVIAANGASLVLIFGILILKLRYDRMERQRR
ncbi:MAG: SemiSWEET family sugar transporter [Terracidiphilus sp.]